MRIPGAHGVLDATRRHSQGKWLVGGRAAVATVRLSSIMIAAIACALCCAVGEARAATGPQWMIEHFSLSRLGNYQQPFTAGALVMREPTGGSSATGDIIHYTSLSACPRRAMGSMMPCYGLADAAPAAGSIALYDNESWANTPAGEQADPCGSAATFAAAVRAAGATPAIYFGDKGAYDDDARVACAAQAAGAGGWLILGQQHTEAHTTSYLAGLEAIARRADAAQPGLHYSFGLSTRRTYSATAYRIAQDFRAVRAKHPDWLGWLNIITYDGCASKAPQVASYLGMTPTRRPTH